MNMMEEFVEWLRKETAENPDLDTAQMVHYTTKALEKFLNEKHLYRKAP